MKKIFRDLSNLMKEMFGLGKATVVGNTVNDEIEIDDILKEQLEASLKYNVSDIIEKYRPIVTDDKSKKSTRSSINIQGNNYSKQQVTRKSERTGGNNKEHHNDSSREI